MSVETWSTVDIRCGARGGWEVRLPDRHEGVRCDTLDDAQRVGYQAALGRTPCQLVVHDAYHRVVRRQLVGSGGR